MPAGAPHSGNNQMVDQLQITNIPVNHIIRDSPVVVLMVIKVVGTQPRLVAILSMLAGVQGDNALPFRVVKN